MILAIVLGFIGGFALGIVPLRKAGYSWKHAFRQLLIAEGLSIAVMETFEVLVRFILRCYGSQARDSIFWAGMVLGLIAGFIAAYPVNYIFVRKGIRHQH
jgi:H+/Cl- antiporter ClcA